MHIASYRFTFKTIHPEPLPIVTSRDTFAISYYECSKAYDFSVIVFAHLCSGHLNKTLTITIKNHKNEKSNFKPNAGFGGICFRSL